MFKKKIMTNYSKIRKDALKQWESHSKRVFKKTEILTDSFECKWQNEAEAFGYNHISIFCSIGQFGSHITDLLRDHRFDKYEFDQSGGINEMLFRYYSRILLIASEIFTDFQDLYIISDNKLTTKQLGRLKANDLRTLQDSARLTLGNGTNKLIQLLDYTNKIC
jgi:hypothetical protein